MYWSLTLALLGVSHLAESTFWLPDDVTPLHYDLRLLYDIDPDTNHTYFGVVSILITANKSTNEVILHADDYYYVLNVTVIKEDISDAPLIPIDSVTLNKTHDLATIKLSSSLIRGHNYTITLSFSGTLDGKYPGAYITSYDDKSTKTKEYLVCTYFFRTHAHNAFPCFDEPQYKATFSLTIGHHKNYTAVSNMPRIWTNLSDNGFEIYWHAEFIENVIRKKLSVFVWDRFQTSLPMSTNQLAFIVSKFSYVESPAGLSRVKFRTWARKDAINQTSYASLIAPKMLSYYERWFNMSLPLTKIDLFAVPYYEDSESNWGLAMFPERYLLYDKNDYILQCKHIIAQMTAYELSHQWFGNLVSLKLQSEIWLFEGIAKFMMSFAESSVEPDWHIDEHNTFYDLALVLSRYSLHSTPAISQPVAHPNDIYELDMFFNRRCSIHLRMLYLVLGENVFRSAIAKFLKKYKFSSVKSDDLWQMLTDESLQHVGLMPGVTVKQVMDTWTTQAGYPVLNVTRNYMEKTVTVRQKRYLHLGVVQKMESFWVPLRALHGAAWPGAVGTRGAVEWLADTEGVTSEHKLKQSAESWEWLVYNTDMAVLCRINYDHRNWRLLSAVLASDQFTLIPDLGRVQLVTDAFALAWSGHLDYATTLHLVSYLKREVNINPMYMGMAGLYNIEFAMKHSADYGIFQKFVRSLISPLYERAGGLARMEIVNGADFTSVMMQELTSQWACEFKVPGCEENAMELFRRWMVTVDPDENNPIPMDLRKTVYKVGISRGGLAEWQFMMDRLQNTRVETATEMMKTALMQSRDVWILQSYMELAITGDPDRHWKIDSDEIRSVATNPLGFHVVKDFIYNRVKDIKKKFGLNKLLYIIASVLEQFSTQRELDEFLSWIDLQSEYIEGFKTKFEITHSIEGAKVNIAWVKRNQKLFVDKLRELVE